MMKFIAPALLIFAVLTDPMGHTTYIAKSQIIAIKATLGEECEHDAHTKVFTSAGTFCVAESPDEVWREVEDTK